MIQMCVFFFVSLIQVVDGCNSNFFSFSFVAIMSVFLLFGVVVTHNPLDVYVVFCNGMEKAAREASVEFQICYSIFCLLPIVENIIMIKTQICLHHSNLTSFWQ
jgi:hypothetical protein